MPSVSSHAPGRFCWVELATTDQPAARAFYGGLFGWAKGLGATLAMGPQDVAEVGRFAMLRDPQGAAFYVFQPAGPGAGGKVGP